MARVIMITSGKGGVGKTTVCANLGIALASLGKKVCMIDMDLGLKNLDVMMGLENRVFYDLKDADSGDIGFHLLALHLCDHRLELTVIIWGGVAITASAAST